MNYDKTYSYFIDKLKNNETFSVARYCDGEWICMLEIPRAINTVRAKDAGRGFPEFSKKLLEIVENPIEYDICIQPYALKLFKKYIDPYIKAIDYFNADVFCNMSLEGKINELFNALSDKNVIIVGPEYLTKLSNRVNFAHIKTPFGTLVQDFDGIEENLLSLLAKTSLDTKDTVLLYSCSFAAKALIDTVYKKYKTQLTQMDMGSVFDPYCGVFSRGYHRKIGENLKNEL